MLKIFEKIHYGMEWARSAPTWRFSISPMAEIASSYITLMCQMRIRPRQKISFPFLIRIRAHLIHEGILFYS
jgi:hypothetical protein